MFCDKVAAIQRYLMLHSRILVRFIKISSFLTSNTIHSSKTLQPCFNPTSIAMPVTRRQIDTTAGPPEGVSEDDDSWQELVTLRRKLRILSSKDKQYCEKQENKLLTQKRLIEAVERENGELKRALSLQVTQKDKMVHEMTDLLERQDVWKEQV